MQANIELTDCGYGKSGVRLVKVTRDGRRHYLKDINIDVQFFGQFHSAYQDGDNQTILPTDTIKNTIYGLARQCSVLDIEKFGLQLGIHFLRRNPRISRVLTTVSENLWDRIECGDRVHDHAFRCSAIEQRNAVIEKTRDSVLIKAGLTGLTVLKSSRSAFENFLRDEYTTLKETRDRILASTITAQWSYNMHAEKFTELWKNIRSTLLQTFAEHDSKSVQHTLFAMGEAVMMQFNCIDEIRLSMPNRHHILIDLSPFHLDNPNEIFVPIDQPSGLIEAALARSVAGAVTSKSGNKSELICTRES
jgi:urate oxidase